jgi:Protein of unknown function (DUF2776)
VIAFGAINLTLGIVVLVFSSRPYAVAPGFILIGLSLVCFSILSKVLLLALVWRREFALANRIPLIPIATCLTCLFMAAFLFQAELTKQQFLHPGARAHRARSGLLHPVLDRLCPRSRNVHPERVPNAQPGRSAPRRRVILGCP